jgi:hypothetical protein
VQRIVAFLIAVLAARTAPAAVQTVDFESFAGNRTPCSPEVKVVASGLTIRGGEILKNNFGFSPANPTAFYHSMEGCSGPRWNQQREITFEFQFPADSISLDLMQGEYEDRTYVFRDQDDGQYSVDMPKAQVGRPSTLMKRVALPFTAVRRLTLTHNQPSAEWGFGVDNIEFDSTPVALTFAITAQTPEPERRVLTHKYRTEDAYPSEHQERDGRVFIRATVKAGDQPRSGVKVWFRVVDPPDAAPYVVRAGDHRDDDNHDPLGGRLTRTEATSDGEGKVETELEITSFAAGDNYRVEASFNEDFSCPNGKCPSTGVLTAWKRVYVEVNKMFRRGTTVRREVVPGAKEIRVWDTTPFPAPPFLVRLVHASPVAAATQEFYSEVVEVHGVEDEILPTGEQAGVLKLSEAPAASGVAKRYSGGEIVGTLTNQPRGYLGDAVGLVTGVRRTDYFLPNGTLVNRTFADAYVEHLWMTDAIEGVDADLDAAQPRMFFDGTIPFHPLLNENPDRWETEWLARKWMRNASRSGTRRNAAPNHQVVFTAASHPHDLAFNRTSDGFNDLWLFIKKMSNVSLSGEAFVHELAHQWRVNAGTNTGGHCDALLGKTQQVYNRPAKCTMTSYMYGDPLDSERTDGHVAFHYTRVGEHRDSEYLTIRRRAEPVPQVGLPRGEQ